MSNFLGSQYDNVDVFELSLELAEFISITFTEFQRVHNDFHIDDTGLLEKVNAIVDAMNAYIGAPVDRTALNEAAESLRVLPEIFRDLWI